MRGFFFPVKPESIRMIVQLDGVLSLTRTLWIEARTREDRAKYYAHLNSLLDQRLVLMKARDAAAVSLSP